MRTLPSRTVMYDALVGRDASFDGVFVAAIRTTGIFCRPTCPARKPNAENVEYFTDPASAVEAGYRACKRCDPLRPPGDHPEWVHMLLARLESDGDQRIKDADLVTMKIEPARARRYFREYFGMTFHAYQRAHRMGASLSQLNDGQKLDHVVHGSGFESSSGFRDAFQRIFGSAPGRARSQRSIVATIYSTPVGSMVCAARDDGVCLLEFADRKAISSQGEALARWFDEPVVPGRNTHIESMGQELDAYFRGQLECFRTPLVIAGTPFQCQVWERLRAIPYGRTRSYEDIARELGRVEARRAVGRANGLNRIAIVIPCHRVVQKDGGLRGYAGGLWRKRFLLDLEQESSTQANDADMLFAASR